MGSSSLDLQILKILITTMLFQTVQQWSQGLKTSNFKISTMILGWGWGVGGQVKLYTHLLRFVKNATSGQNWKLHKNSLPPPGNFGHSRCLLISEVVVQIYRLRLII